MMRTDLAGRTGPLVIVGDTMLDVDIDGDCERMCPDAPAPVVDLAAQHQRPGGAGLAAMLAAGARHDVVLVTALGRDRAAEHLWDMLTARMSVVALPVHGGTVCKTRVRASGQTLVRLDSGQARAGTGPLPDRAAEALRSAGAILVADYGRGVAGDPRLRELLAEVCERVPVVWDPHPKGAAPVPGTWLATPNESEAAGFARAAGTPGGDATTDAAALREAWRARAVAVTCGGRGAVLADGRLNILTPPRETPVPAGADTCGAGDAFSSAAAGALLGGRSVPGAVRAALVAASRFVRGGGATTMNQPASGPAVTSGDAHDVVSRVRDRGGRIVATGGCFDLLHPGHVSLLRQARSLGDALVVCVNSDRSIRGLKGPGRPINTVADRVRLLEALEPVDAVLVFDEFSPAALLESLRPDVWVKGEDYADTAMPEADVVRRHGGQVVFVPLASDYSTSRLVAAIERNAASPAPAEVA